VRPLRVAVVGLGSIGFEHLARLRARPGVDVAGVCDSSATVARAVAERFGTGLAYSDLGRMLAEVRPDVVHVLTPPDSHAALAVQSIEAGAHVLVEKPIAPTWDEYVCMRDTARRHGRLLCEDYNTRFAPAALAAAAACGAGRIGDVVAVDVAYGGLMPADGPYWDSDVPHFAHALPGGALQNFITHPLSLALPYLGGCLDVVAVQRRLAVGFASNDELRAVLAGPRAAGTITVSGLSRPPHLVLTVRGTAGWLEADILANRLHIRDQGSPAAAAFRRGIGDVVAGAALVGGKLTGRHDRYRGLGTLIDAFHRAAAGQAAPPVSVPEMDDVNGAMRAVFAAGATA
jgi:predicted dehydrogenase